MNETTKSNKRRVNDPLFQEIFKPGTLVLDIGGGNDPFNKGGEFPGVKTYLFDKQIQDHIKGTPYISRWIIGDANHILTWFHDIKNCFDVVYSSHCLEHLDNPAQALRDWMTLVKPGGYMVVVVPDEDLYEQGVWPSQFHSGHKWGFEIFAGNERSNRLSEKIISIPDIILSLPDEFGTSRYSVIDTNYDYSLQCRINPATGKMYDQTMPPYNAEANIEFVIRKVE